MAKKHKADPNGAVARGRDSIPSDADAEGDPNAASASNLDVVDQPPQAREDDALPAVALSDESDSPKASPQRFTALRVCARPAYGHVVQVEPLRFQFVESLTASGTPRAALFVNAGDTDRGVAISCALGDLDFFPLLLVEESPKISSLIGIARGLHVPEGMVIAIPFSLPQDEVQLGAVARRLLAARSSGIRCPIWAQRWRVRAELEGGGPGGNPWGARIVIAQAGIGEEMAARKDLDSLNRMFGLAVEAVANNALEIT